jgi:hypothetical protein
VIPHVTHAHTSLSPCRAAALRSSPREQISQLFVIGGDGTMRGALRLAAECAALHLNIAIVGERSPRRVPSARVLAFCSGSHHGMMPLWA